VVSAKNILVAYDGSDAGRRALEAAADLVGYGSTLAVVAMNRTRAARDPLAEANRYLNARHVFARYLDAAGDPAGTLLDTAEKVGADVIVVDRLNGSLDSVVRSASCDVLVVR
jgi:nucleotide-binding universal stress UspA family protein